MTLALAPLRLPRFAAGQDIQKPPRDAAAPAQEALAATSPALMRLFREIPKTDLHVHLSGSTPLGLIRKFLRETGWSRYQVGKQIRLPGAFKDLDDFLAFYYRVPAHVRTPGQFRRAAQAIVEDAAKENVRYLEIRSSILTKSASTPLDIVEAIEDGMRDGMASVRQKTGKDIKVGLIVLAQRNGTPAQSLETARLAVAFAKRPGSLICGFDLAGSESTVSVYRHREALEYVKRHGMNLTVHAGETPGSENLTGVQSIQAAMSLGADRIGHGIQAINDRRMMRAFAKAGTPLEICPWSNVQISNVPSYAQHPIRQFLERGLNVSLNTDNRMVSQITQTKQLAQLYQHGVIRCWEQVKTLSYNGVKSAFISPFEKKRLMDGFAQEFAKIEQRYRPVIDRFFCKPCTHPVSSHLRQTG